jgi:hypothetical protein
MTILTIYLLFWFDSFFKQFQALFKIPECLSSQQYFTIKINLCNNYYLYITFNEKTFSRHSFSKQDFKLVVRSLLGCSCCWNHDNVRSLVIFALSQDKFSSARTNYPLDCYLLIIIIAKTSGMSELLLTPQILSLSALNVLWISTCLWT